MTERNVISRLGSLGLAAQAVLVSVALGATWLIVAPIGSSIFGTPALVAAAVAAGICWVGALLALLVAAVLQGPSAAMHRLVVGMLARAMMPLVVGALLQTRVAALADAGFIYYLLVSYLVSLVVETMLLLAHVQTTLQSNKAL